MVWYNKMLFMSLNFLTKRNFLFFAGGVLLAVLFVCVSILVYFASGYKGVGGVNLILLGGSGPENTRSNLTDSIIFSSVEKKGTVFVSVPRDLWYQPWQTKINSVHYYGQEKGDGLLWTKEILSEILGQKIDYAVLVDFAVFKDLVDLVGGVEVVVERTFDDFRYPIAGREEDFCDGDPEFGCRYEHVHFEAGQTHLGGEQALKFVRSRYAEGEEGTDTARSGRQQKVITALKAKILSPKVFLSPTKIIKLKEIFEKRIQSDLGRDGFILLGKILLAPKARQTQSFVLDGWQEESGLIYHPQKHPSGQWVLLPRDSSWEEVHLYLSCLLSQKNKSLCSPAGKQASPEF